MRDDSNHSLRSFVPSFRIILHRNVHCHEQLAAKCSREMRCFNSSPIYTSCFCLFYVYTSTFFNFFKFFFRRLKPEKEWLLNSSNSGTCHALSIHKNGTRSNFIIGILILQCYLHYATYQVLYQLLPEISHRDLCIKIYSFKPEKRVVVT